MQHVEHMSTPRLEGVGPQWPRSGPFVLSQLVPCICHWRKPMPNMHQMVFWAITQITLITDTRALEMQATFNGAELKAWRVCIRFKSILSIIKILIWYLHLLRKYFHSTFFLHCKAVVKWLFPMKHNVSEEVFNTLIKMRQASKGVEATCQAKTL